MCLDLITNFGSECVEPIDNSNVVFILPSDFKDMGGGFYKMKRKYGKFTRPTFKTEEEIKAYIESLKNYFTISNP